MQIKNQKSAFLVHKSGWKGMNIEQGTLILEVGSVACLVLK